ncbi:MAG TPA: SDR family NAD(P)-dependent oxidoreductase [Saprospiraceae bacterium]|nr:SDR family NAD(P)-dependent oxidoreductase [Saprospiraceae bacterium]HNT19565.1 SDR family NAD(P)-dependent oxidoreductase [Saprospiraceae bacterium]
MKTERINLFNWGGYPHHNCRIYHPETVEEIQELVRSKHSFIARGNGRCYGDSALSNRVISTLALNRILDFDPISGLIVCEAGVLLDTVLKKIVPAGFFLPVSPGTKFISIGGAFASDVHGKNQQVDGVFSDHVSYIKLVEPGGELVHLTPSDDLFRQTAGGMGLTGIIVEVALRLRRIESQMISQRSIKAKNLAEVFDLFEQNSGSTYSVAWIDGMARGYKLGRSILLLGEHAAQTDVANLKTRELHVNSKLNLPFYFPSWVLNPLFLKVFNWAYFTRPGSSGNGIIHYDSFFYPLDKIRHWNRIYGKKGFVQYQFVLPGAVAYEGIKHVLEVLSINQLWPYLAVLKRFGTSHEGRYLHFPMEGYTMSLDLKISQRLWAVLNQLDEVVSSLGGKTYLAKDARLGGKNFRKQYPVMPSIPPNPVFISHQQVRFQQMKKHVFLILGANSDIAKQTALLYLKKYPEGYLILASRDVQGLRAFIEESGIGGCSEAVPLDVENFAGHALFYSALSAKPNWVMYAAGVLYTNDECMGDAPKSARNTSVNFSAPVNLLNIAVDDNNPGLQRIIGMSSIAGLRGRKSNFQYGSAKAGFHQYLFGLRQDLKDRGVVVQAITPGRVNTKMTAHLPVHKRANTPEEVASAILQNTTTFEVYPNLFWRLIGMVVKYAPEVLIRKL